MALVISAVLSGAAAALHRPRSAQRRSSASSPLVVIGAALLAFRALRGEATARAVTQP